VRKHQVNQPCLDFGVMGASHRTAFFASQRLRLNIGVIPKSECSLCDLSVLCFRIADWVGPYLKKSALWSKRSVAAP